MQTRAHVSLSRARGREGAAPPGDAADTTRNDTDPTEGEVGQAVTKVLANMGFFRNISSFTGVILGGVVLRASRLQEP